MIAPRWLLAALAVFFCCCLPFSLRADDTPAAKPPEKIVWRMVQTLDPRTAQVGDVGPIAPNRLSKTGVMTDRTYTVKEVTSPKQVVITDDLFNRPVDFAINGLDTSKMVTGRVIDLDGIFKVVKVGKRGTRSILMLEAEPAEEREQRLAKQKAIAEMLAKNDAAAKAKWDEEQAEKKQQIAREAVKAKLKAKDEAAAGLLAIAREFVQAGKPEKALERLRKLVKEYPDTKPAAEARELIKKLEKS